MSELHIYGTNQCRFCRGAKKALDSDSIEYTFTDILDSLENLKAFIKIRDLDDVYEDIRNGSGEKLGIPLYCLDGTYTRDIKDVFKAFGDNREYFDVVDEQGNPTGEIVEREKAHREGIRHRTSHVWLMNNKGEVLIQKRNADKDSYPNCYDISSAGHLRCGDDNVTSALRELKEELGIELKENDLHEIGVTYSDSQNIFHGQPFHNVQISKVYLAYSPYETFSLQKEELAEVRWVDLEELKQQVKNNEIKHCIKLSELDMISEYLKKAHD